MIRLLPVFGFLLISLTAIGQGYEKEAKKQTKALQKEGWQTLPQDEALIDQLTASLELRGNAFQTRTLVSEGAASHANFDVAMKASKLAAQRNLAGLFASSVSSLVQSSQSSELQGYLSESVVKIAASLKSNTVMRIYQEADGSYEFRTVVSCKYRDFWNLLPPEEKSKLESQFGLTDEAFKDTDG